MKGYVDTDSYVYIGRRNDVHNPWCNPYPLSKWSREESLALYKIHLKKQILSGEITIDMLKSLAGKELGCFCKPLPCHGDILNKVVQWALTK